MKRSEQIKNTKKNIVDSALKIFGQKEFESASINDICKNAGISKGIIYHYFKNKDDLYLECVKKCFETLVDYLLSCSIESQPVENNIGEYINLRHQFFLDNPECKNIFFNAVLGKPVHLEKQIKVLKTPLDNINLNFYKKTLENFKFKDGITMDDAIDIFTLLQCSFNPNLESQLKIMDADSFIEKQEDFIKKLLKIIFYGIGEEQTSGKH